MLGVYGSVEHNLVDRRAFLCTITKVVSEAGAYCKMESSKSSQQSAEMLNNGEVGYITILMIYATSSCEAR